MNYWSNKNDNMKKAIQHTNFVADKYFEEILYSTANTKVYNESYTFTNNVVDQGYRPFVVLEAMDSVEVLYLAVHGTATFRTAILNFASYNNPGGMFLDGSMAQEEFLCHSSFLFNVLREFDSTYYKNNRNSKNRGLYKDRALFTPDIRFWRPEVCSNGTVVNIEEKFNVITCAAPNKSLLYKYGNFTEEENTEALRSRIKFILNIAVENNINFLVLGAWGCGVFKQNPVEVATIFKEEIGKLNVSGITGGMTIVFAIPPGNNHEAFKNIIYSK